MLNRKLKIWYDSTHTNVVSGHKPFSINNPLILVMSAFFLQKISIFLGKNSTFTQSNSVRAVLEIF